MKANVPVEDFEEFLEKARRIFDAAETSNIRSFELFVEKSSKLVVDPVRKDLIRVKPRLASLKNFLLPTKLDLLRVAGLTYAEDPYTELIAWVMDPDVNPNAALEIQRSWLNRLEITEPIEQPASPKTQFRTADGIPDLVLEYPKFLVIVEAKTGSDEHLTPGSLRYQTESYPSATRKALNLPELHPTFMVFLTPDRRAPKNGDAKPTTYLEFATSMATALTGVELAGDLRSLYSAIVTHFVTCAAVDGLETKELFDWIDQTRPSTPSDATILQNLSMLMRVFSLLGD